MSTIFFTESMLAMAESRAELECLLQSGARIGVLVNGNRDPGFLEKSCRPKTRLSSRVDRDLVIYTDKLTDDILATAAVEARKNAGQALFVGEYCEERSSALNAGFDAAIPHPSLVSEVLDGERLVYGRVSGLSRDYVDRRMERLLNLPVLPVHITAEESGSAYVITSGRIAELIRKTGFNVITFDDHDPQTTDLYLVRDDRKVPEGEDPTKFAMDFLKRQGTAKFVVAPVHNWLMLALPSDISIEEIHFSSPRQGHSWSLSPDRYLWQPEDRVLFRRTTDAIVSPVSKSLLNGGLTLKEKEELEHGIDAKTIERWHSPYVGKTLLKVGEKSYKIRSRHTSREENQYVTDGLVEHLTQIGGDLLIVNCRPFEYGGKTLSNVEAELPGTQPDEIVIVSAHFDSIATDVQGGYPAPGADDDASGMAGVLAAAEVAVKLRRELGAFKRTLRFILFNAEERSVNGSKKYVRTLPRDITIAGVFQMDMIGFHGGKPTVFEIHAGYQHSDDVETKSRLLAERVRDVAAFVSPSLVNRGNPASPQIYPRDGEFDPAEGQSDHSRFHECGHAACMISEDYNTDPWDITYPDPQVNPNYHESDDEVIDYAYAADIARAVAGAAIVTAKG